MAERPICQNIPEKQFSAVVIGFVKVTLLAISFLHKFRRRRNPDYFGMCLKTGDIFFLPQLALLQQICKTTSLFDKAQSGKLTKSNKTLRTLSLRTQNTYAVHPHRAPNNPAPMSGKITRFSQFSERLIQLGLSLSLGRSCSIGKVSLKLRDIQSCHG